MLHSLPILKWPLDAALFLCFQRRNQNHNIFIILAREFYFSPFFFNSAAIFKWIARALLRKREKEREGERVFPLLVRCSFSSQWSGLVGRCSFDCVSPRPYSSSPRMFLCTLLPRLTDIPGTGKLRTRTEPDESKTSTEKQSARARGRFFSRGKRGKGRKEEKVESRVRIGTVVVGCRNWFGSSVVFGWAWGGHDSLVVLCSFVRNSFSRFWLKVWKTLRVTGWLMCLVLSMTWNHALSLVDIK